MPTARHTGGVRLHRPFIDLAVLLPALFPNTDNETLDATYKENVKDYALRVPYVSVAGLSSIIDFRAEATAEAKKLALEKMFDNSLLREIQKEITTPK